MPLLSTSSANSSRSSRRFALVTRSLPTPWHAADPRVHYKRRVVAAAPGFVVGVGLLLAGVVINVIPVAVAGFVVMLTCSLWAVDSYRRMTGSTTGRAPAQGTRSGEERRAAKGGRPGRQAVLGLMGRVEERWRRRQEGGR